MTGASSISIPVDATAGRSGIDPYLAKIEKSGFVLIPSSDGTGSSKYVSRSVPPIEFEYSVFPDDARLEQLPTRNLDSLGLEAQGHQWLDLDGEGLPGILVKDSALGFHYAHNVSANTRDSEGRPTARFRALELIDSQPNADVANSQFVDVAGDGKIDLVTTNSDAWGFFEREISLRNEICSWGPFFPFAKHPNASIDDPYLRFVDLTGDGLADILITEDQVFTWYKCLGRDGYAERSSLFYSIDEERSPRVVLADQDQSVYLADMSGDGLVDIVRVRNGDVCYWPNMGYGYFGSKVTLGNSPWFGGLDCFNQKRVLLTDIDGSGTTDVIYLSASGGCDIYLNESGNSLSKPKRVPSIPAVDTLSSVTSADVLGNGTGCLVWTSEQPASARRPAAFIDLTDGEKPHLLTKVRNNRGATRIMHYAPSTKFYLDDMDAGKPWITRLPYPVHCVEVVESLDEISKNRFTTRYRYHYGHFDGSEREFRGFAMVETWIRTSMARQEADVKTGKMRIFLQIFFRHIKLLPDTVLPKIALTTDELREACRSLKGRELRREIYADDRTVKEKIPYIVIESNFTVEVRQGLTGGTINKHAVFLTNRRESISYQYERSLNDPRVSHLLILETDRFGNKVKSVNVAYGREVEQLELTRGGKDQQKKLALIYDENDWTEWIDEADQYHGPRDSGFRSFEILGFPLASGRLRFAFEDLTGTAGLNTLPVISYEEAPTPGEKQKRLIEETVIKYRSNDLSVLLPKDRLHYLGIPGEVYVKAYTPGLIQKVFSRPDASRTKQPLIPDPQVVLGGTSGEKGGYMDLYGDGHWWLPSGRQYFHHSSTADPQQELAEARRHFFNMLRQTDPFGQRTTFDYDYYDLRPIRTEDAAGNITQAKLDYRTLQPRTVTDSNGNVSEIAFDELGNVNAVAIGGKNLPEVQEGDRFDTAFRPYLTQSDLDQLYATPLQASSDILGSATIRYVYDYSILPTFVASLQRETHVSDLQPTEFSKIQVVFSYFDGFSRQIQMKSRAERARPSSGEAEPPSRWVGSGWTVFNNKGNIVRQYEPFFDSSHHFKDEKLEGVSKLNFYDPLGRVVGTLFPDHSWIKTAFEPWRSRMYDRNDTAGQSDPRNDDDVGGHFARLDTTEFLPSWRDIKLAGTELDEKEAARKVLVHDGTETTVHFDSLGRSFLSVVKNKTEYADGSTPTVAEESHFTFAKLDIEGNELEIRDARNYVSATSDFDMLNHNIRSSTPEAGERWSLLDAVGNPLYAWDNRGRTTRTAYDELRRPLATLLQEGNRPEIVVERTEYGEAATNAELHNLRGRAVRNHDQAGLLTTDEYYFKGNMTSAKRQVALRHEGILVQSAAAPAPLDGNLPTYMARRQFDALNRPVTITTNPDNSTIRHTYNDTGLLKTVSASIRGSTSATPFITGIEYNAKGQRTLVDYQNQTKTAYTYDLLTWRLKRLITTRDRMAFPISYLLQDLTYTYDPVGNITCVRDDAQDEIYFSGARVEPKCEYTYDAKYQMVEASGREHVGQTTGGNPTPPGGLDSFHTRHVNPGDSNAMARYHERYVYDSVGNISNLRHLGKDNLHQGWTREYKYEMESPLELGTGHMNNLLTSTTTQGMRAEYTYDGSGNMLSCPTVRSMKWDWRNQLVESSTQVVSNGGAPERTFYSYDAGGGRIRKFVENQRGPGETALAKGQRLYLGVHEVYISYVGGSVSKNEESLHIFDNKRRIALVETTTDSGSSRSTQQLIRYQYSNHQGSSTVELTELAILISYEEYFPFGSTSYQALSSPEVSKRYRYTGKERDAETHLQFSGQRYYIPWIGRWLSADPAGMVDGTNLYAYARNNPVTFVDSNGMKCDPKTASCDPTIPTTPREQEAQASLPEDQRHLPASSEATTPEAAAGPPPSSGGSAPPTKKAAASPPPPVSPIDYTLYVPEGLVYTQTVAAFNEALNADNPWYTRAGMFTLGVLADPLALAEEYVARPIVNIPFIVENAGIKLGEHIARAQLWAEQGETAEAVVDSLHAVVSFSEGFVALATVAAPLAGSAESAAVRETTSSALPRSGPIGRSVGAMSRAEALARKLGMNVNSPTTRQVLNSLDMTCEQFIGAFRRGSINKEFPSECFKMTLEEALSYSTKVKKLLVDGRFVK